MEPKVRSDGDELMVRPLRVKLFLASFVWLRFGR